MDRYGPCMCGDTECPSCGPLQGNTDMFDERDPDDFEELEEDAEELEEEDEESYDDEDELDDEEE